MGEDARPDPEVTAPQANVEQAQVACAWCGLFSPPGPACEVCGSPLPSSESSQASWTPAAIKYMEGEPTQHTFQVVDRPADVAQPTPIPLVTPIAAQQDSGNAAALVEQAETLLKETKSLLLETASLLKERTDATKTAEPDGNGASDQAVEDLLEAAAELEERTEALREEPELRDQLVEELPEVIAEPEPEAVGVEEPEPEQPEAEERPKVTFDLGWTEPDLETTLDLVDHEPVEEPEAVDEAAVVEESEAKTSRRFRWRSRKRDEPEEAQPQEPQSEEPVEPVLALLEPAEPDADEPEPMQAVIETVQPSVPQAEPEPPEPEEAIPEPEPEPEPEFVEPEPEPVPEVVEPEPQPEPEPAFVEVELAEPEPEVVKPEEVEAELVEPVLETPPPASRRRREGASLQQAMEAAVERSFFVPTEEEEAGEKLEAPAEPPPAVEESKERGWPWRRQKKASPAEPILVQEPEPAPLPPEPDLVQPAASVTDPVLSSVPIPPREASESIPSPSADLLAEPAPPPQAAEAAPAPPTVAQQRYVGWSEQPEDGAHPMALPPPLEDITPLPVEVPPLAAVPPPSVEQEVPGSSADKVPCSRCGQPSERGLCEACLDAIAELRQLSAQFGM